MKTLASGNPGAGHMNYLPKLRLKRTRTCSSDSGCDVLCDSPNLSSTIMEDAIHTWEIRLDSVVKQEVERAREVTCWAKEALRHAAEDEERRQEVLESWRSQLEGIMEFTKDLVDCVNNDTKEVMNDTMGLAAGHESTSTIDEVEEDDEEKEEEIMQLFLLSAMGRNRYFQKRGKSGNKSLMKEFMSIYKKHGKVFKSSRKASKEVQSAYSKIKRQESFAKRRLSLEETNFINEYASQDDFAYSQKMFDSVLESAEIFNDWHWNFIESESCENIFADWRWNFDVQVNLKVKYYDDPDIKTEWNEFNFWKINDLSENLMPDVDSEFLEDIEDDNVWTNCKFWQNSNDNDIILHSMMDDVLEENESKEEIHFWDENKPNQSILQSLIEEDVKVSQDKADDEDELIWEIKDIALSLIDIESAEVEVRPKEISYIWNDYETNSSLQMSKNNKDFNPIKNQDLFQWEDPNYIKMLFNYEEQPDLICFSDENDDFFPSDDQTHNHCKEIENKTMDLYPFERKKSDNKDESTDWLLWPLWNEFGSVKDIMKAYDETYRFDTKKYLDVNIQEVFWDKSLEDRKLAAGSHSVPWVPHEAGTTRHHKKTPKDPANIFKSFKHVFLVPNKHKREGVAKKETQLYEDMEDVFADWASIALADERSEKKRQLRGRKKERIYGGSNKENEPKSGLGHKRPGTPTIKTVNKPSSNKHYDFNSCWIETNIPQKERKTAHVWKNARSQKRLNSKIYAKQPRSIQ